MIFGKERRLPQQNVKRKNYEIWCTDDRICMTLKQNALGITAKYLRYKNAKTFTLFFKRHLVLLQYIVELPYLQTNNFLSILTYSFIYCKTIFFIYYSVLENLQYNREKNTVIMLTPT